MPPCRTLTTAVRYGELVWEHKEMDELRRTECLCRLCSRLKPSRPDNCPQAQLLFEQLCVPHGMAMAVTRCKEFKPKV